MANRQRKKPPGGRRRPWWWVVAGLVASGALAFWTSRWTTDETSLKTGAARGFHVLLVTLDTTRADRLGCYGHATASTPNLDALASEGIRFTRALAPTPMTLPSHASLLTGLDPPGHGVRHNEGFRLSPSAVTLTERLKTAGYDTAAFVSAFVLDARFGLDQGFDHYDAEVQAAAGAGFGQENQRDARAVTDAAVRWLANRQGNTPYFAWVHYFDPHEPYQPPSPYRERFGASPYDGEIAYVDAQFGRLLDALDRKGDRDRTVILVVGDHGESLGDHGEPTHSLFIYEATQRVPMILACRGLSTRSRVVDDVVGVVDVMPTLLDLLDLPAREPSHGISLVGATAEATDRAIYLETLATSLSHGWAPLHALRRRADKYILAPRPEYYDLEADPNELTNLLAAPTASTRAAAATLAAQLSERIEALQRDGVGADAAMSASAETRARLESLGYVSTNRPDGGAAPLDPKDMIGNWSLMRDCLALTNAGRLDEALAKAQAALARSPKDRIIFQQIGEIHAFSGRYDKAEEALRAANAIEETSGVLRLLAQILMPQGRLDEAETALSQAERLEPDHGGTLIARGDMFAFRGHFEEALAAYRRAIDLDPYRAAGMAQQRIQRVESAMRSRE